MSELLFGAVASLLGGLLFVGGVNRLLRAARIYRTETRPVREAAASDGKVEFHGTIERRAEADEYGTEAATTGTFAAPFSGEDAVCCEVWMEVESRHRTDADGMEVGGAQGPSNTRNTERSWGLAESDEIRRAFLVADGGGRVEIDPSGADLDLGGYMGEVVLTAASGEELPEEVRDRLDALGDRGVEFDCDPDTWEKIDENVQYREERLGPGDDVHVIGADVRSQPEEWGSAIDATVGDAGDESFVISRGSESQVLRRNAVQFVTGVVFGGGLLAGGLHLLGVM